MISSKFIINVHSLLKAALYFRGHDLVPTFNHFRPPPLYADQLTCHTPKVKSPTPYAANPVRQQEQSNSVL